MVRARVKMLVSVLFWVFFVGSASEASDFRFCDLEGTIESHERSQPDAGPLRHELKIRVDRAVTERRRRSPRQGYTDCSEFVGMTVDIRLRIPSRHGEPRRGDRVAFNYASVDVVDGQDQWSTSVRTEFHEYSRSGAN